MDDDNSHPPPAYTPARPKHSPSPPVLRRHRSTLYLLLFFLPLLVIPWVATCILDVRPISGASSYSTHTVSVEEEVPQGVASWYRAVQVLTVVAAVLTVPIVSAVLSHAAVVIIQRRRPSQKLNAMEMLSLVDAPWSRLETGQRVPNFVYCGLALILVGFLQLILQSAFVVPEQVMVATYLDVPNARGVGNPLAVRRHTTLGYEADPTSMALVPRRVVSEAVAAKLSVETDHVVQPHLWFDQYASTRQNADFGALDGSLYAYVTDKSKFFASSVPSSADTGVLRYHALRLNSSVQCEPIAPTAFPSTCSGSRPFVGDTTLSVNSSEMIRIRWCVPGAYDVVPWTLSRDRQDISEDMYFDVTAPSTRMATEVLAIFFDVNFTLHCSASTTRGYFELPSNHNQHQPGRLLEKWPTREELADFNDEDSQGDVMETIDKSHHSSSDDMWDTGEWPVGASLLPTPGPLAASLISMLGNESWFHLLQNETLLSDQAASDAIYTAICSSRFPFESWEILSYDGFYEARSACNSLDLNIAIGDSTSQLVKLAYEWFAGFNITNEPLPSLKAAMFYANEALLTASTGQHPSLPGRRIASSIGTAVVKPKVSLPAKVIISILLAVEVLALVGLAVFIYRVPTFARRLDAFSTAAIGAQLSSAGVQMPGLGRVGRLEKKAVKILEHYDGVIGFGDPYTSGADTTGTREVVREARLSGSSTAQGTPLSEGILLGDFGNPVEGPTTRSPAAPAGILVVGGMSTVSR